MFVGSYRAVPAKAYLGVWSAGLKHGGKLFHALGKALDRLGDLVISARRPGRLYNRLILQRIRKQQRRDEQVAIFGHRSHRAAGFLRLRIDQPAKSDQMGFLTVPAGDRIGPSTNLKCDLSHRLSPRGCDQRIYAANRGTYLLTQLLVTLNERWVGVAGSGDGRCLGGQSFDACGSTLEPADSEFQAVVGHRCYHSM